MFFSQSFDFISLPFADLLSHLPFVPAAVKFKEAGKHLDTFALLLLTHLRDLQQKGELNDLCFGHALLEFSKQKGVTEEDLLQEILIMFIAGM